MKLIRGLVAAAALAVSGQAGAVTWTLKIDTTLTGMTSFTKSSACIDPVLGFPNASTACGGGLVFGDITEVFNFTEFVTVEAFAGSAPFTFFRFGGPNGLPFRNYRYVSGDGTVTLTDGRLIGTGLTMLAAPFADCLSGLGTCYFTQATAPTFSINFVSSDGGPGPIPEPATWLMMIIGFGLIGAARRRSFRPPARPSSRPAGSLRCRAR